jgi:hypothetical protein
MTKWMGLFLAILLTLFSNTNISAQETPPEPSHAKMTISENSWDFGFIPQQSFVSHIYKITNEGKDSLIIQRVRPACGCTAAPLKKDKLAPGESTDLLVTFNSGKYAGPTRKGIYITSNDSLYPGRSIEFSAVVGDKNPTVTITPEAIEFDSILTGKGERKYIKLANFSGGKLKVSLIDNPNGYLKIKIKDKELASQGSTQIEVRLKENIEPGWLKTSFTLELEGSQKTRVTIPVKALIKVE